MRLWRHSEYLVGTYPAPAPINFNKIRVARIYIKCFMIVVSLKSVESFILMKYVWVKLNYRASADYLPVASYCSHSHFLLVVTLVITLRYGNSKTKQKSYASKRFIEALNADFQIKIMSLEKQMNAWIHCLRLWMYYNVNHVNGTAVSQEEVTMWRFLFDDRRKC